MPSYPTELLPTANGVQSYTTPPEDAATAFTAAQLKASPVDRIVGAFDALRRTSRRWMPTAWPSLHPAPSRSCSTVFTARARRP